MGLTRLLLLSSLLLPAPLVAIDTVHPAAQVEARQGVEGLPQAITPERDAKQMSDPSNVAVGPDDICYKIRVYLFKRDDDHAPELTGSTTCGPRQPRAQNVVWPGARLVPAN